MDREDEAWDAVAARWHDEDAHETYLASHGGDLEGLAEAGRRYRAVLDRDPRDEVALRWRDEVVRRATAIALAQLPRTAPAPSRTGVRRGLVVVLVVAFLVGLAYALIRMGALRQGAMP